MLPPDFDLDQLHQEELITNRELRAVGVSSSEVSRLIGRGLLERIGKGVYRHTNSPVTENHEIKLAAAQVKKSVIVLISALRFHHLGTQVPHAVWLMIPAKARVPTCSWPKLHIVRSRRAESFSHGVTVHDLEGTKVSITTPARTVADCFKFRSQLGLDVCLEALRELLTRDRNVMAELTRFARMNRVLRIMQPYLEAIG